MLHKYMKDAPCYRPPPDGKRYDATPAARLSLALCVCVCVCVRLYCTLFPSSFCYRRCSAGMGWRGRISLGGHVVFDNNRFAISPEMETELFDLFEVRQQKQAEDFRLTCVFWCVKHPWLLRENLANCKLLLLLVAEWGSAQSRPRGRCLFLAPSFQSVEREGITFANLKVSVSAKWLKHHPICICPRPAPPLSAPPAPPPPPPRLRLPSAFFYLSFFSAEVGFHVTLFLLACCLSCSCSCAPAVVSCRCAHPQRAEMTTEAGQHLPYPPHFRVVPIEIDIGAGEGSATVLGSDLTAEYVHINGDYRS